MGLNIRQVITQKYENLKEYLRTLDNVAVAFSSGVDSTFLLKTAQNVLGDNVTAITAKSCVFPQRELDSAVEFCEKEKIKHIVIETDFLALKDYKKNDTNRCAICKKELYSKIVNAAKENGIKNVIEGSSFNEETNRKEEIKILEDMDIKMPLLETEFSKDEIRILSNGMNLPTWNKRSFTCLADRFIYGENITKEKIKMVDEAEQIMFNIGFRQFRVWIHSKLARIEVSRNELAKLLSHKDKLVEKFKAIGFDYVTMDFTNYRNGKMTEMLNKKEY